MFNLIRSVGPVLSSAVESYASRGSIRSISTRVIPVFKQASEEAWRPLNPFESKMIEKIEIEGWNSVKENCMIDKTVEKLDIYPTKIPNFAWASMEGYFKEFSETNP